MSRHDAIWRLIKWSYVGQRRDAVVARLRIPQGSEQTLIWPRHSAVHPLPCPVSERSQVDEWHPLLYTLWARAHGRVFGPRAKRVFYPDRHGETGYLTEWPAHASDDHMTYLMICSLYICIYTFFFSHTGCSMTSGAVTGAMTNKWKRCEHLRWSLDLKMGFLCRQRAVL